MKDYEIMFSAGICYNSAKRTKNLKLKKAFIDKMKSHMNNLSGVGSNSTYLRGRINKLERELKENAV